MDIYTSEETEEKNFGLGFNGNGIGFGNRYARQRIYSDRELLTEYATNDIVYTCVEMNATSVASTNWNVCQIQSTAKSTTTNKRLKGVKLSRKERKRLLNRKAVNLPDDSELVQLTSHKLIDMLRDATDGVNGCQLFKITTTWLEILGVAYWYIDLETKSITPLKPWRMLPNLDQYGNVESWQYRNGNDGERAANAVSLADIKTLSLEEVVAFRYISPTSPISGGMAPLQAALRSVMLSSQYMNWLNTMLSNRQRPDYALIPTSEENQALSESEIERAFSNLFKRTGGSNNGKPIILKGWQLIPLSFSPTDLAPLEIQAEVLKRVAGAFGIPTALADSDAATYSNYETAMEHWARSAILPRIGVIEQTINENLEKFGVDPEDEVIFCFDNPVPEDEEFQLETTKVNVTKLTAAALASVKLTPNEKRALLGFEPIKGGDEIEAAPVTPPASTASEPSEPPAEAETTASDDGSGDNTPSNEADKRARMDSVLKINGMVAAGELPRATAVNLVVELLGVEDKRAAQLVGFAVAKAEQTPCGCGQCRAGAITPPTLETKASNAKAPKGEEATAKKIEAVVKGFFGKLRPKVLARVKRYDLVGYLTKDTLPDEFVPLDEWTDDLSDDIKPVLEFGIKDSATDKQTEYVRAGASPDAFDVVPKRVKEAADKRAFRFAQSTMATTTKSINDAIKAVREQILDGVLSGNTVTELTNRVNDVFENAEKYQAERIARTEASSAVHMGQVISAKESGIVKGFKYLISSDACPLCMEYDGDEIDIDDYDMSGEVDAEGTVPLHPNCSCSLTEIIDLGGNDNESDNQDDNE